MSLNIFVHEKTPHRGAFSFYYLRRFFAPFLAFRFAFFFFGIKEMGNEISLYPLPATMRSFHGKID